MSSLFVSRTSKRRILWLVVIVTVLMVICLLESSTAFVIAPPQQQQHGQRRRYPAAAAFRVQQQHDTKRQPSCLSVGTEEPATSMMPLIPAEDDDDDDEENVMNGLVSSFLDLDTHLDDDDEDDDYSENDSNTTPTTTAVVDPHHHDEMTTTADHHNIENNNEAGASADADADDLLFVRDEADRLEELEDRYYVDESGMKRKVERCILVGVEDVSALRKKRRQEEKEQQQQQLLAGSDSLYEQHFANNNNGQQQQQQQHETNNNNNNEHPYFTLEESMVEMRELIKTAGLELCGEITQRLNQVNPKSYIGTGKVQEANALLEQQHACTIVFDAELTPGQQKALENAFNKKVLQNDFLVQEGEIKVIDRTALILDIFCQHAKTREGKLQVDLALHEYRKPRLTRMWTHLERQSGAGGVGLRGPGESQLEIDKRLLRDRILVLKQKIADVQKQRSMHRKGRERTGLPILALVGYTNAGKSSFLNYLTRAGVMAESMLFATLDPTTRRVKLPGFRTSPEVLLTDTVGFIQKLPTHLVAAFRATLEEVQQADVLVHVIDVSNPTWEKQERAVRSVLRDLNVADKPVVRVLNKIDLLDAEQAEYIQYEAATAPDGMYTVAVSALHGTGMQDFVAVAEQAMAELLVPMEVELPYKMGDELHSIHEQGNVELVDYRETGTYVKALVPRSIAMRLQEYSVAPESASSATAVIDTTTIAAAPEDQADDEEEIDWAALGRGRHSANKNEE